MKSNQASKASKELKTWHYTALELRKDGLSSRQICEELGFPRTRKSTINDFFKRHDLENPNVGEVSSSFEVMFDKEVVVNNLIENYIKTIEKLELEKPTILVIADTQCKSEVDLSYMDWIGKYLADKKPDIIVHIGDHYDFPSLSSYDKGKLSAESRRLNKDIESGNLGFEKLNKYINSIKDYSPRKVFCMGNHENRLDRYVEDRPELQGTLGTEFLPFDFYGWEVHDFLKPVEINGIFFVHYLANPFSGKPYSGTASSILKTVGRSFVVGHKQLLDIAIRPTIDGKQQIGIVNGAAYEHQEDYKGYQGNNHFRGLTILHEVSDGFAVPSFVSLGYLKGKYECT